MTILSNHRITSYKKARNLSPTVVKMPFKNQPHYNKKASAANKLIEALLYAHLSSNVAPIQTVLVALPPPSAPPCTMVDRTIYVWDQEYHVQLPVDFDIYEGLRRWYPDLYKAVMEENEMIRGDPSTPNLSEEEMEEAWARYEYLEYLSDY